MTELCVPTRTPSGRRQEHYPCPVGNSVPSALDDWPSNWPAVVDASLARRALERRARRATNTGRPASPSRPYALSMLHCAACGVRLIGDTDYYRHYEPCTDFTSATPTWPRSWRGRRDGKSY